MPDTIYVYALYVPEILETCTFPNEDAEVDAGYEPVVELTGRWV